MQVFGYIGRYVLLFLLISRSTRRPFKILVILVTIVLFTSCDKSCRKVVSEYNEDKPEEVRIYPDCNDTSKYLYEIYYENGQLHAKGNKVNGRMDGDWLEWAKNGTLIASWHMDIGKSNGLTLCWHANGVKKREVYTKNGMQHGKIIDWDEKGNLKHIGWMKDDKMDSTWIRYLRNGGWLIENYREDSLHGPFHRHNIDSTGELSIELGNYVEGKEVGIWKWFDSDSLISAEGKYSNGKKDSIWIYYKKGKIKEVVFHKNGETEKRIDAYDANGRKMLNNGNGQIKDYYDNGALEYLGNYRDSVQHGTVQWYFQNGKLRENATYKNGYPIKSIYYYENGELATELIYNNEGERNGVCKWYYENGQLQTSAMYKNGLRVDVYKSYGPNGNELESGTLKEGNGTWILYNDKGEVDHVSEYKDGVKMEKRE